MYVFRRETFARRRTGLVAVVATAAMLTMAGPVAARQPAAPAKPAADRQASPPSAPRPLPLSAKRSAAPAEQAGTRIVGGAPVNFGEFPYFVALLGTSGGELRCGGSLLSTTQVLTAAHCVTGLAPADLQAVIGGTTLAGADLGVNRKIGSITVDPAFDPATLRHDVAVLTLANPITRADTRVQWLRLAQGNELGLVDPDDTATVIGHGSATPDGPNSPDLRKVVVPIQSDTTMADPTRYGTAFDPATMVGAGPLAGGQGFCRGDDGGPLVLAATPQDVQLGAVSFANGCAQPDLPGVYGELYQGDVAAFVNARVPRPANDGFAGATVLPGNAGATTGTNENATLDPGETGAEADVWYTWTPSESGTAQVTVNQHGFDSEVAVLTGSSVTGLTTVAANDDANGTLQSEVEFAAVAGTTYRIRVDGFSFDYGPFTIGYGVNRPANDDFASATNLAGETAVAGIVFTTGATGQAGEPSPVNGAANASVWYSWTAPASGTGRFIAVGTYDTTLAVYTGSTLAGLTQVGANDDANGTRQSLLTVPVTAGVTYRVQVGGFAGARGITEAQVAVNPEANDLFSTAQAISGTAGTVFGSNLRAIGEPGEPEFNGGAHSSVWYRWTAPVSGTFRVTTAGSSFNTVLAVTRGATLPGLTVILVNDNDGSGGEQSALDFAAVAGTTYQFLVKGVSTGNRGSIQLNWRQV
ncbi:S1 family serine peptidase [Actinophytocola oryzae]|uniref:Secreted trypsin-like serine protease n=1 Tax=Actinophytocola oryzae TaxID=502181 RepID=A0A4R7W837_9PSEU|nr:serine protease [Actinophytocola oryzae]TDV57857.1 secreted trypsin-like serine protease [Actinophytocola oryzae]